MVWNHLPKQSLKPISITDLSKSTLLKRKAYTYYSPCPNKEMVVFK